MDADAFSSARGAGGQTLRGQGKNSDQKELHKTMHLVSPFALLDAFLLLLIRMFVNGSFLKG